MTSQPDITERQMELFFLYCSPNVFLMTVAWYLLIQKVKVTSPLIISALKNITKCGLGIYMVHYFAVGIGYLAIDRIIYLYSCVFQRQLYLCLSYRGV